MTETPIAYQGREVLTFRQIDRLNNTAKGAAFRAFKRIRENLVEGQDFFYLDAGEQAAFIESLRRQGLIYESTIHCVLLTRHAYECMRLNNQAD